MQLIVKRPSVYDQDEGNEYFGLHIVPLSKFRLSGNLASDTIIVISVEPVDGNAKVSGYRDYVTISEIFAVLGNVCGCYESVRFINIHGRWDYKLNDLLSFLL